MMVGVEFIGNQLSDSEKRTLAVLNPDVVKIRRPGLVADLLDVLPEVRILARSDGEGYDVGDVANSYDHWRDTLYRYASNIIAYEFSNEPNHPNHAVDPVWWAGGVVGWLNQLGSHPVAFMTPGLVPHVRIDEWRVALDSLGVQQRAVHCYFQSDGPEAGVRAALAQAGDVPPTYICCTELNSAGPTAVYQPTIEQRADECRRAMSAFAQAGIRAACLFSLTPWQGGDWEYYYPLDVTASILAAGRTPARPKRPRVAKPVAIPVEEVMAETFTFESLRFEWPARLDNWRDQIRLNTETSGISAEWQRNREKLGAALTPEVPLADGGIGQLYERGAIRYQDGVGAAVVDA